MQLIHPPLDEDTSTIRLDAEHFAHDPQVAFRGQPTATLDFKIATYNALSVSAPHKAKFLSDANLRRVHLATRLASGLQCVVPIR